MVDRRSFITAFAGGLWASRPWAGARATSGLQESARHAWLFVLPLIELAALRARPTANDGKPTPINVLRHGRALAGPKSRAVTTPNNDTLYSTAFVDTTKGPVRLELPDCNGRYLSVQLTDMYTNNNFILSPRTPGRSPGVWRLLSPDSHPRDARELRLATPHAWLTVRILVKGQADLPALHTIQDRVGLEGPAFPPPSNAATRTSDWPAYFAAAQQLLESDPPPFKNGLDAFIRVRDAGGRGDFSRASYAPEAAAAIDAGVAEAAAIGDTVRLRQRFVDGWTYPRPDLGDFGDNFVFRAIVAMVGLGALTPAEAMYMRAQGDGHGLFTGDELYRFNLSGPVPVDGFWSLTMYKPTGDGQFFLTDNPLMRYSIGDRTEGLIRGPGGALDIWIGRSDPGGERTANWLPAPRAGPFALTFRAYLPRPELLGGMYRLPSIARV